nr:hypothetical protein [Tanacetum cinerariifolium]
MSSDNAPSAVTYTSISFDSDGPSWGILLINAGELPEMDPYEEEHVPIYVSDPEHPKYHVPSNDDMQFEDQPFADDALLIAESPGHIADLDLMEEDSIDYPDKPEDDDEDLEEDPKENHTEYPSDGGDAADIEAFETNESAPTPRSPQTRIPFFQTRLYKAWKTVKLKPPMSASMEARIAEHVAIPIPPTSPAYGQAPLGPRVAIICMRYDILEEDMPPRRRFVFIAPPYRCHVVESFAVAAARPPRAQYDFVSLKILSRTRKFVHQEY